MITVAVRTFIVYFLIIGMLRLMGKRQLGELQPSELVTTILVSNLASLPVEDTELPLVSSLLPVLLIVSLEIFVSFFEVRSQKVSGIVSGKPKVVIVDGRINQTALRELRFSIDDLLEALRNKDVFDPREVAYGIVETNGTLNVFKKFENREVFNADLQLKSGSVDRPPIALVLDGVVQDEGIALCAMSKDELKRKMDSLHLPLSETFLLQLDSDGKFFAVKKEAEA